MILSDISVIRPVLASVNEVETQITLLIEERISGVEDMPFIASTGEGGLSLVTVEFTAGRDVDGAANDIRDRVAGILGDLPVEADPPEIEKVNYNDEVLMWLNLTSDRMTVPERPIMPIDIRSIISLC
jgi:multidrug efflux pump